jgi:hypothetical protein
MSGIESYSVEMPLAIPVSSRQGSRVEGVLWYDDGQGSADEETHPEYRDDFQSLT